MADSIETYYVGYHDGRGNRPVDQAHKDDPVYLMGYANGEVALEAAENGYDPRFG